MSDVTTAAVEEWLDRHWDSDNRREIGAQEYDEGSWLKKVVDAGYAVPTWSQEWFGLGLGGREARHIEKSIPEKAGARLGARSFSSRGYHNLQVGQR